MALQTLEGAGLWVPNVVAVSATIAATTYVLDASGEKAVLILRCPRAGVLDRFDAQVAVVTNSPDNGLRFSFQGVNAADGQNDGTILGATNNAFVTYAHTVTTGWKSTNFGETVTVTRGQLIACVIDIPSFTASDSVALSHIAYGGTTSGFPYGISVTGTKNQLNLLIVALHYTDGYAFLSSLIPGADTVGSVSYDVNDATADEWGLAFQVPWPCKLNQVVFLGSVAAAGDFEVLVYDASDTVISTLTQDGDVTQSISTRSYQFFTQTELTLTANVTYRVTIRPTTAGNIALEYLTFQSAALMHTMEGGEKFYMTSRLNQAGSWTNYNSGTFRRPRISLHLTAFDDGVSAGGAPGSAGAFA